MSILGDMAAEWAAEDARADTDAAYEDAKHAKRAAAVADAATPEGQMPLEQAEVLANAAWTGVDIGASKLAGRQYKLTTEEKAELVEAWAPVVQKYVPADYGVDDLEDLIPIELVALGTVVAVYWPKYRASVRAEEKGAREKAAAAAKPPEKEVPGQVTERRLNVV